MAGVDIRTFIAHSTRSTSTSAGWRAESIFAKHYKLPIAKNFGKQL